MAGEDDDDVDDDVDVNVGVEVEVEVEVEVDDDDEECFALAILSENAARTAARTSPSQFQRRGWDRR